MSDSDIIKGVKRYNIVDQTGKEVYNGNKSTFTHKGLSSDRYYFYYLTGIGKKDELVTERIAITVKTKAMNKAERAFSYMITATKSFSFGWQSVENSKDKYYNIYKDGELLTRTTDFSYIDTEIVQGKQYAYSVTTVVSAQEKNENGELVTIDRKLSFQTTVDTSKINNNADFTIADAWDADHPYVKFSTFIRHDKESAPDVWGDCPDGDTLYFEGDNRDLQYTGGTYRTAQKMYINFANQTYSYDEGAGQTHGWCQKPDGTTYNHQYATADMNDSYVTNVYWQDGLVGFFMDLAENNPLATGSPVIDAEIDFGIYQGDGITSGVTSLYIYHDGFPDYEIYRKDGYLDIVQVFTFDAEANGQGPGSLFWPMEWSSQVTK